MATQKTNYAKATLWGANMKQQVEGPMPAVCLLTFESLTTEHQALVLTKIQAAHNDRKASDKEKV